MKHDNKNHAEFAYMKEYCCIHKKEWWQDRKEQVIEPAFEILRPSSHQL